MHVIQDTQSQSEVKENTCDKDPDPPYSVVLTEHDYTS